jgi:hypothetical protein
MRTTLDIDADVLAGAEEIAGLQRQSLGKVVSNLARQALPRSAKLETRNGIPLARPQARPVVLTMEIVNALRDATR